MIRVGDSVRHPGARYLHREIGEVGISVSSDLDDVLEDFATLYRGYPAGTGDTHRTIRMHVQQTKRSRMARARYLVLGDGEVIGAERRREEALPFVEWGINWRVITRWTNYLQIHAATMAYAGHGVMFAGASGCGKSTLVAGLLSRGWKYLSDELALVDPHTLHVHPFPKAVCIKAGAFDSVRRVGIPFAGRRHYVKGLKGRVGYLNPLDLGPDRLGDPSPIRFVFFPKYVADGEPRVYPVKRPRAVFALAAGALNRTAFAAQALSTLSEVVRRAECFGLETGPIEDTTDLVESVVMSRLQS